MAESTLSLTYTDLQKAVGLFLGYGIDYATWAAAITSKVDEIIKSGFRQFLYPPPINGIAYSWSFLRPITTLTTSAVAGTLVDGTAVYSGTTLHTTMTVLASTFLDHMVGATITFTTSEEEYEIVSVTSDKIVVLEGDASAETGAFTVSILDTYHLPDGFGGMDGDITIKDQTGYPPIVCINEGMIRKLYQQYPDQTGVPQYYAIRPFTTLSGTYTVQRFEIIFFPCPDDEYVLTYRYQILPDKMTATTYYALGGMPHSETIIESCLDIAESRENDEQGIHRARWLEKLAASIAYDRKSFSVDYFGYMGNGGARNGDPNTGVTELYVNGVLQ